MKVLENKASLGKLLDRITVAPCFDDSQVANAVCLHSARQGSACLCNIRNALDRPSLGLKLVIKIVENARAVA